MKILLVDDSKSARYALRLQLQKQGAEVEMAESAEDAFEKLKAALPDAILMDHMMPGLNGFEALDVIRDNPRTAAIPVIMCTSHEEPEFVATAEKKGVFGILPKSAAPELLPGMLERLQADLTAQAATAAAPPVMPTSTPMPTPTPAPAAAPMPVATAAPSVSDATLTQLIDAQLQAQVPALVAPLLETLRGDLNALIRSETERLTATQQATEPAAPSLSEAALTQLIATQLQAQVPSLVAPLLETLRGDLNALIRSETERLSAAQHTAELASKPIAPPTPTMADLQAISTRLATETLPDLIKRALQAERVQTQEWVEKRLDEVTAHSAASEAQERLDADDIARKAVAIARRESQEAINAALEKALQSIQSLEQRLPALGPVYAFIVFAAVIGLGAAGAVYYLLSAV
ncbi:Response regulator receiver domain-containing protein [Allochromatium warmingii]|uniref:Response regulator receiver domain-containing protein n=1 Tax=Allochromatium warmingii TaxID=61595 RepID=A0A1H3GYF8_ALLWA|nr:response regulator [Allochromatium warmingii]SDY07985.1 Response regulator receiver domain-containing protein [Allochromatium warmingii]